MENSKPPHTPATPSDEKSSHDNGHHHHNHNKPTKGASPSKASTGTSASSPSPVPVGGGSMKASSSLSKDWRVELQRTSLSKKWEYMLENELYTDTIFLVGKSLEPVKCHSVVLKMHSAEFEAILKSQNRQDHEITFCTPSVFRKMLKYLYTDHLEVTVEDAMETLLLAKRFHLDILQEKCGKIVSKGITSENAPSLMNKATEIGDKKLALKAQEYIIEHAREVLFTEGFKNLNGSCLQKLLLTDRLLWKIDEVTLFQAVRAWASAECVRKGLDNSSSHQYDVAKDALNLIQYDKFSAIQFTSEVVKSRILPNEMMLKIQSDLIEKEEERKYYGRPISASPIPHVLNTNDTANDDESASNNVINDLSHMDERSDLGNLLTLTRYSVPVLKDWDSGEYKISFLVSKPINLVGVSLYGHGNGDKSEVDVFIKVLSSDEETVLWNLETKHILPVSGGEFDVMFTHPVSIQRQDWFTISVFVDGRISPYGTGGKKNYMVQAGKEIVEFNFRNSQGVIGASQLRGQLPKLYFSLSEDGYGT